jgi:four helix bundle protein
MACASPPDAMPHNLDKLNVYHKAVAAAGAVSAIMRRRSFKWDRRLREQLGSASESVASLISEGSEQSTDRHFSEYCYRSKGSAREIRTQLIIAVQRGHITEAERTALDGRYEEIGRMLNGLIERLERNQPARKNKDR